MAAIIFAALLYALAILGIAPALGVLLPAAIVSLSNLLKREPAAFRATVAAILVRWAESIRPRAS